MHICQAAAMGLSHKALTNIGNRFRYMSGNILKRPSKSVLYLWFEPLIIHGEEPYESFWIQIGGVTKDAKLKRRGEISVQGPRGRVEKVKSLRLTYS